MGKKPDSLNILERRPTVGEYDGLSKDDRSLADTFIKDGLRSGQYLRIEGKPKRPKSFDFWQLEWGDVIQLKMAIDGKEILDALKMVYRITDEQFLSLDLFNCFSCFKWINESIGSIRDIEANELGGELTEEEMSIGVEILEPFDYAYTLDVLSKGNLLQEDELLKQPYSIIFRKLCLNKAKNEIEKNRIEYANRKAKRNRH